ncbi:IST1-like [Oopsacas minuta]|uniref:IST1 homolog n=1 Tax=Oopsacas minuta TaxID=111878 RepID=A0AAV7JKC7_9METZ|nr:IST1-like [Oopsacas minuta]
MNIGGFNSLKLQTNLKLCVSRYELLIKKKTEQSQRARKDISDLLRAGRFERARIKVEHVIREDYVTEAMEILQQYCDLLLARAGLIETMGYCEEGLLECVNTIIWATPRVQHDIQESVEVEKQLGKKFGKAFLEQAHANRTNIVNEKVSHRLGVTPPSPVLIERYLEEIAKNYGLSYQADSKVILAENIPEPITDKLAHTLQSEISTQTVQSGGASFQTPAAPAPPTTEHKDIGTGGKEDDDELDDLLDRFNALKKKN